MRSLSSGTIIPLLILATLLGLSSEARADDLIQRGERGDRRTYVEALQRLHATTLDVRFDEAPLKDYFRFLARAGDVNVVVHPKAEIEDATVSLNLKGFRLINALKIVLEQHELRAVYRFGVFLIVPKEEAGKNLVLRIYPIRDMLHPIRDFPGPDMNLEPSQSGFFAEAEEPEVIERSLSGDDVVAMIEQYTGGESWEENPRASVSLYSGLLVVRQSESVHREIRRLLAGLRGSR